jgi:L-iditol 2-dehydrogenase
MTDTGRAAVFYGPERRFAIEEFPLSEPEPGAILVRVTIAGVCGSDLHTWRGEMGTPPGGVITGHEMTGRVARLGPGVTRDSLGRQLAEGDRIAYMHIYPCGRCYVCLRGPMAACPTKRRPANLKAPPYFTGAFAEYYYLWPGHYVFKIPDELPDEVVAPVNCALSHVLYGLQEIGLTFGDRIVIQGAGGLGIYAVAVAREMGAHRIIVVDGIPQRLELARAFGADEAIDLNEFPSAEARVARVRALTDGLGADVVAELVGMPSVIGEGLEMLRPGGRYLEIGSISRGNTATVNTQDLVLQNKRIVGINNYSPWIMPAALDFLVRTRGRFPYDRLISHRYPLDEINTAFEQADWQGPGGAATVTRAVLVP